MRPVRAWSFSFALVAAACSTPPLVGEYQGPARARGNAAAEPENVWVPAKLELLADGSCWWHPARDTRGLASILTLLGRWHLDTSRPGPDTVVVHPDKDHPEQALRFDVTTASGETVLVAEDGSRFARTH